MDDPAPWRQAYDTFEMILKEYGVLNVNERGDFWSCCASFVARRQHIHRQPLQFFEKSLEAIRQMDVPASVAGRWWEYNWYRVFGMQDQSVEDIKDYLLVDQSDWQTDLPSLNRLLNGRPFSGGFTG